MSLIPGADTLPGPRRAENRLLTASSIATSLVIAVACFIFFFSQLETTRSVVRIDDCVIGSDAAKYNEAFNVGNYWILKVRKHPLAVAAVGALAWPLQQAGVAAAVAGSAALAFIQALGGALLFLFARRLMPGGDLPAALLTLLYLSAFGTVTIFSVTDIYGITFATIIFSLLAFWAITPLAGHSPWLAAILAGSIAAVPGLVNPPALAFTLGYAGLAWAQLPRNPLKKLMAGIVVPSGIAIAASLLPTVYIDLDEGFAWQQHFLQSYATASNFADPRIVIDYLVNVAVYSFAAPLDYLQCRFGAADLGAFAGAPLKLATWIAFVGVLGWGMVRSFRSPFTLAMLAAFACLVIFYIYFNPDESLLYSSQWVLALCLAAAPGLGPNRETSVAMGVAVALCWMVNLAPLHDPRTVDANVCCPTGPPAN